MGTDAGISHTTTGATECRMLRVNVLNKRSAIQHSAPTKESDRLTASDTTMCCRLGDGAGRKKQAATRGGGSPKTPAVADGTGSTSITKSSSEPSERASSITESFLVRKKDC